VAAVIACAAYATRVSVAQPAESPCDLSTSERVVAVGDVHGAYKEFTSILREAGLVDERDRWIGGRAHLVQTGDIFDRGPDSIRVMELLRRLERDASRAGGRVHALLGNHEVMRLVGDWRYVSEAEMASFRDRDSEALRQQVYETASANAERQARKEKRPFDAAAWRERFMKEIPLGWLEMRAAFQGTADYGKWVRARPTIVKVNGVAFLHGGVSDEVSKLGCGGINATVAKELAAPVPPPEQLLTLLSSGENGPLWYRGLADQPEDTFGPTLEAILERLQARAVVIGHTPTLKGVRTRFGGRVVLIDTGMLDGAFYPGGQPSALEVRGETLTAIYLNGRREPIAARLPAPGTVPASR
jgi:hypothetical protein